MTAELLCLPPGTPGQGNGVFRRRMTATERDFAHLSVVFGAHICVATKGWSSASLCVLLKDGLGGVPGPRLGRGSARLCGLCQMRPFCGVIVTEK